MIGTSSTCSWVVEDSCKIYLAVILYDNVGTIQLTLKPILCDFELKRGEQN